MNELSVGKEVLSYCSKDKHALAHIIVSMKDSVTIGKVQCKTCKSTQAYKDPATVRGRKTVKKNSLGRTTTQKKSNSDMWLEAVNNSKSKSQAYSVKTRYELGDIVDHPKFGPGVIEKLIDADKIQVIFRHDVKTLIHNK